MQESTACQERYDAMLPQATSENVPSATKGPQIGSLRQRQEPCPGGRNKKNSLKLNARSRNVYENKGPLWKTRR